MQLPHSPAVARLLGAGQVEVVAEDIHQGPAGVDQQVALLAVDLELDGQLACLGYDAQSVTAFLDLRQSEFELRNACYISTALTSPSPSQPCSGVRTANSRVPECEMSSGRTRLLRYWCSESPE